MTAITTKYPFVGSIETRQGGRKENQDNAGYVDTPIGLLLVVCDGMGGGPGGRTASLMAVDTILTVLSDVSEHTKRDDALRFVIEKANETIYAKAMENPELRGMGTTVAAILINETSAIVAHVGDTRVYQLRKGTIVYRSADHSLVAILVRQKKITEEQARNHPRSNVITRALGIRPTVEIEFDEVPFQTGDRFVICTDGIWGMMPQPDLVVSLSHVMGIIELTSSVAEQIDRIGQENGGGHDNLTLAVLDTTFDSSQKGSKKRKNHSFHSFMTGEGSVRKWILCIGAVAITVLLVTLLFILLNRGVNTEVKQNMTDDVKDVKQENLIEAEPTAAQPQEQPNEEPRIEKMSQNEEDSHDEVREVEEKMRQHNTEVGKQIKEVVKDLDSLKTIRGRNRKDAVVRKQKYVNNTIKPDVNSLGKKVSHKKKRLVKAIINMLNNNKTVQSSRIGGPTEEGNQHIDRIKIEVNKLQD